MDILMLILTSLMSVAALFVITKLMGHKQVAQLDFFDYISGITIGSIAAEMATELEEPWKPLLALVLYGAVSIVLNAVTGKIPKSRKYINGTPTILMDNGKIYRENLRKSKLDLSEFLLLCRQMGYFDLSQIETAVFEHNGRLSVLPKSESAPLTPKDMKIPVSKASIGAEIIMDGEIMGENLTRIGKDEKWLERKLQALGHNTHKDILLCVFSADDELTVYPMNNVE